VTGKQPADYYKDEAATMPDGSVDATQRDTRYNQEFSDRNQRMVMNNALINGYRYTHDSDAPAIADALRGTVLGDYHAVPAAVPEDGYGQRYAVAITRPSDGTTTTVILPRNDWLNIQRMQQAKQAAAAQGKADTAAPQNNPYRPPAPSGQSASVPAAIANWWKGTGIPTQPTQ
jgi:hypothetical protein